MVRKIHFSFPKGSYPRLCLLGNSNVGKSSLTKEILSHPRWYKGKVGKTAGSTVRLTIINDPELKYHVIDLPGFGRMVRLSRKEERIVQEEIIRYLDYDKKNIFLCLVVISAERLEDEIKKWYLERKDTIPLTIEFLTLLNEYSIPHAIVLNKIDKLNKYKQQSLLERFLEVLADFNIHIEGPHSPYGLLEIFKTSIKTKEGINDLKRFISKRAKMIDYSQFDPSPDFYKEKEKGAASEKKPVSKPNQKRNGRTQGVHKLSKRKRYKRRR